MNSIHQSISVVAGVKARYPQPLTAEVGGVKTRVCYRWCMFAVSYWSRKCDFYT